MQAVTKCYVKVWAFKFLRSLRECCVSKNLNGSKILIRQMGQCLSPSQMLNGCFNMDNFSPLLRKRYWAGFLQWNEAMTWTLKSKTSLQRKWNMGVKTHWKPCASFYPLHPHHLLHHHPVLCPPLSFPFPRGFSCRTWNLILSLCSCLF